MYDEYLLVNNTRAFNSFYAQERIFIETTSGDIITRHVTSASGTESGEFETLTIETPLDRDLTQDEIRCFGRYVLCRFDIDELEMRAITSVASSCEIDFAELVNEYTAESFTS
jgi:hypothetical protein